MVYCGKPSPGCAMCRKRRIKCDQVKPQCSQCMRLELPCQGYRNSHTETFRDQTQDVIRKANSKKPGGQIVRPPGRLAQSPPSRIPYDSLSKDRGLDVSGNQLESPQVYGTTPSLPLSMLYNVTQSVETQATCFFLSFYVHGSHFEYLPALYRQSGMDEHLSACIRAVGLASFANEHKSPHLSKAASKQYVTALHLTNEALRCPSQALQDTILLSVMLLGHYEIIRCRDQASLPPWIEHMAGATQLLKLRGQQQMSTGLGLHLFKQISNAILVSCVQRQIPLPEDIVVLRRFAENFISIDDPGWRFSQITVRLANFLAAVKAGTLFDTVSIISSARMIEKEYIDWSTMLPPIWRYETVFTKTNHTAIWNGYYHVYNDHLICLIWNSIRMARILLNEAIVDQLPAYISLLDLQPNEHALEYDTLLHASNDLFREMSSDICASIPQYIDFANPGESSPSLGTVSLQGLASSKESLWPADDLKVSLTKSTKLSTSSAACGYYLLWPLVMVGAQRATPPALKSWCINRLERIGTSMHVSQAFDAIAVLERGIKVESWLPMCQVF